MLGEKEEVRDGASGCKKTEYSIYVGGGVHARRQYVSDTLVS